MNNTKSNLTISPERLAQLAAAIRARKEESAQSLHENAVTSNVTEINSLSLNTPNSVGIDKYGNSINYNEEQLRFMELASKGESCILIGAAGTGKTTCTRGAVTSLISNGRLGTLHSDGHKYLKDETPGIVLVSYTRRAVANLRKAMSDDLKSNCLTIHALLEYEPVYYDVEDPETGDTKSVMRFEPTRNTHRPLPSSIRTCVIDEASMVSLELFQELQNALPSNCQFIFLGDIQQLPPVFGSAILGYKMLELPTVELTQVYRQALESPIIRLAHRILSGKSIPPEEYQEWKYQGQLTIHPWKKRIDADNAAITISKFLTTAIESGLYNPDEDMVLIPFNKACGTIELNKRIANFLARRDNKLTYEIIAGFNKHYFSVGDKILYDKEDAVITNIYPNTTYTGIRPQDASARLDYWGFNDSRDEHHITEDSDDIDILLSATMGSDDAEDRVRQASHIVEVEVLDTGTKIKLETAAAINSILLSYALTVHKSQGSEFRKVFLMLHQSHSTMIQRELLYTAVTRAKEELYVICEPDTFTKGILNQRIKGNTLAEKAEFFKGKVERKLA